MTKQNDRLVVVHLDVRKLKPEPEINLPLVSQAKLKKLIEQAVVDAYNENEQTVGFLTMMQEQLALPCSTKDSGR